MKLSFRLLVLFLLSAIGPARAENPDALWQLLHEHCVPGFQASGNPAPCAGVVLPPAGQGGWVLLKDRNGPTQYLLMPSDKITGIEDPQVLAPNEPNFFAQAWLARTLFLGKVGHDLPRSDISLAINSPTGRSQNQLHIHIDCLRADLVPLLTSHLAEFGATFTPFPIDGHAYRARRLEGTDLSDNPFKLLADDPAVGPANLGRQTIVIVSETFPDGRDGFVMLDDQSDLLHGDRASGEDLQDHACAVAKP